MPLLKYLMLSNSVNNDSYFSVRGAFCVPSVVPSSLVHNFFLMSKGGSKADFKVAVEEVKLCSHTACLNEAFPAPSSLNPLWQVSQWMSSRLVFLEGVALLKNQHLPYWRTWEQVWCASLMTPIEVAGGNWLRRVVLVPPCVHHGTQTSTHTHIQRWMMKEKKFRWSTWWKGHIWWQLVCWRILKWSRGSLAKRQGIHIAVFLLFSFKALGSHGSATQITLPNTCVFSKSSPLCTLVRLSFYSLNTSQQGLSVNTRTLVGYTRGKLKTRIGFLK